MFWSKVECDGCNTRLWESQAILHRGSYFCSAACRDAWTHKNPPRIATGNPAALRYDLTHTIDTALDEYRLSTGGASLDQMVGHMIPLIGRANAELDAQVQYEHHTRFLQYAHECVPLLHGLGYAEEAAVLETLGFGGRISDVVAALHRARARAHASTSINNPHDRL
jgi:hypothetical protein